MTDTTIKTNGRAGAATRRDLPDTRAARRVAELEAENAALRRALAEAGLRAEGAAHRHDAQLSRERAGRADDALAAVDAEVRHGREVAAGRADLAASEGTNEALRRANAELAAGRAALREREERLRLVFESATEYAIFTTDLDRRVSSWNAGAERLLGWAEAEIVGGSADAIFTPEDRAAGVPEREAQGALRDGRAADERWHQRRDGSRFWANGLTLPLRDPEAGPAAPPLGLLKVMRDETGRRRAEARLEALVELGDRLRDLRDPAEIARMAAEVTGRGLGAARAGLGVVDAAEETIRIGHDWTRGAAASVTGEHRLAGYWTGFADALRRGEAVAIGDAAHDPRTARHADSYAAVGVRACVHTPVVQAGRVAAVLYVHDAAPRRWTAEEVAFARGVAERAWAAAGRARAEAALRDSERRLRATQDHAGVGIHEVDAEGRYVRVSGTFTRMTGYGLADLAGRSTWDLIEGEADRREARAAFVRLVRGEEDSISERRAYTNRHGRHWWAEVTTTAVRDEGGRFLWAVRVLHDTTERKRAEERRALLVAELNHRVKNTLAVVQSLALQTARGAGDLPAFVPAFQARLIALARAHDLLTRTDWEGAPLAEVARAALDPHTGGCGGRVDLGACTSDTLLPPAKALTLAMALHELATNALKHGALSAPGGRVTVACGAGPEDGATVVEWVERGGPPVPGPPARKGFGLRLLERGLAAQEGMAADLRFEPEGVRCALHLPAPPAGSPARGG